MGEAIKESQTEWTLHQWFSITLRRSASTGNMTQPLTPANWKEKPVEAPSSISCNQKELESEGRGETGGRGGVLWWGLMRVT